MRKDELMNKKVVKAISLALAAVMTATPMTALAEENVPNDDNMGGEQNVTEERSVDATQDAIDNAQNTLSNEKVGNNVVLDDPMTLPSTGEELEVLVVVPDAVEAAGSDDLAGVKTNVGEGDNAEDIDYEVVGINLENTINELKAAEVELGKITLAEDAAAADAKEADAIISEIEENNKVVTESTVAAADAQAKAEEALAEAQSATNKADAQAAVDKAAEAFGEAEAAQAAAKEAYDANVEKLAQAQKELDKAQADLKAAQDAKDATAKELEAAQAAVDEAVANAEALKAQVDADAEALNLTKEVALKAAYDEMIAIKQVYKQYDGAAKDGVDADNDGIEDFTDEFGVEDASTAYWNAARKYFALYLEYVYGDSFEKLTVDRKNTLNNGWKYDAERDNTYTVYYKDANGVEKTATYNYHTADNGDITIYEKQIAIGKTEEVWGTETKEFEDTKLVDKTKTEQQVKSETTYEDALSIANTDNDGNVTYTKLADVQKDTDKVVSVTTDENGKATSVLVKDDNSQLLTSDEVVLNSNQQIVGETLDTYTYGTIDVPTYGEKEVKVTDSERLGSYDNLVNKVNEYQSKYSSDEGYRIEIVFDHGFGYDEVISLEKANNMWVEAGSVLGAWLNCGYEVKVYQTVDDTDNVLGYTTQQVVVKTTTADVKTTHNYTASNDGYLWKSDAIAAMNAKVEELKKAGYTNISCDCRLGWNIWEYEIKYTQTTTANQVVNTEKYTGTAYEMHTIGTTRTWTEDVTVKYQEEQTFKYTCEVPVLLEKSVEYQYWTERKNTSYDDTVKNAIADVEKKLADMAAKQDAAAIALASAMQAQKDVANAQAELKKLVIDNSASQTAAENLRLAQAAYDAAAKDLLKLAEAAAAAEQAYVDAAKELGRFVPATSGGTTVTGGGTPVIAATEPAAEEIELLVEGDAPVAPATPAVVEETEEEEEETLVTIDDEDVPLAPGAEESEGQSIVEIEDEEVPLVAMPTEAEKAKMSWWWLLIVALLGATGYKMYKDHQAKKEESTK